MRVLKWNVPVDDKTHSIGGGSVVHTACQYGPESVQVWTQEHGTPAVAGARRVRVYGTGHPIPTGYRHLGSAVTADGALVWHVFEVSQ